MIYFLKKIDKLLTISLGGIKMKKTIPFKKLMALFLGIFFAMSISSASSAHEMQSGARWINTVTTGGKNYINLAINTTYLNDNMKTPGSTAANNWNNYSGTYVCSYIYNNPASTVDIASCTTWFWFAGGVAGLTNVRDTAGNWYWSFTDGTTSNTGKSINFANIYINPAAEGYSTKIKTQLVTHEIGHVMNLGHNETVSVMSTASATWSDYDKPQDHDRNDLVTYYKSSLGR